MWIAAQLSGVIVIRQTCWNYKEAIIDMQGLVLKVDYTLPPKMYYYTLNYKDLQLNLLD